MHAIDEPRSGSFGRVPATALAFALVALGLSGNARPGPGPATGACCQPEACFEATPIQCGDAGGLYLGDGVPCFSPLGVNQYGSTVNQPIPDGDPEGLVVDIIVPPEEGCLVADVDIGMNIGHFDIGELFIELFAPDGRNVLLWVNQCPGTQGLNATADDEGPANFCGDMPLGANYDPLTFGAPIPLQSLEGVPSDGLWTLRIEDVAPGNPGIFSDWSLSITCGEPTCPQPEPVGACSIGPACELATQAECLGAEGVYEGDGVACVVEDGCKPCPEPGRMIAGPCDDCSNLCPNSGGETIGGASAYLFSGEAFHSAVDLRVPSRGFDFVLGRKYRSRIGPDEGIGAGWDHSYNIKISQASSIAPGEVTDLLFSDKQNMSWTPPVDPGGPPTGLLYCTLRSTDPASFGNAATTSILDPEQPDTSTNDPDNPAPGEMFAYLPRAKNGLRDGTLGTASDGTVRQGLSCGVAGPDLILADGNSRRDVYSLQPDGLLVDREYFRTLERNDDGSYTLTFPDTGTWSFIPLDGSPQQGKIAGAADRKGNTMSYDYDALGRLSAVTDSLGRDYTFDYNPDGFVSSVTDFGGRAVTYDYYEDGDAGESFGDLESVTTPTVTGTPTGNDFPSGKTTVYTYSKGFADERLNHNLLTITDPKGQTFLTNVYATTLDPLDVEFDRIVQQIWGAPTDTIDYHYVAQVPDPSNGFAVVKTIVNDRAGNVSEYLFDVRNLNVRRLDFTGRAVSGTPTTESGNLPTGPLRFDDPPFFESIWEYNADSQMTFVLFPNQNEQRLLYDDANPSRRSQGNLIERCNLPGPLGGDQGQICETFEYDQDFGGCCGTNFVTRHVDARANETLHEYDAAGNRTHTQHRIPSIVEDFEYNSFGQLTAQVHPDNGTGHRRRDEFRYYVIGPQSGFLRDEILDAPGDADTTTYEYDLIGRVTRQIDPRGNDRHFAFNELDQVVRQLSEPVTLGPLAFRYAEDFYYDANDNVVRIDIENRDDEGVVQPNSHFTTVREFDILDNLLKSCEESGNHTAAIPGTVDQPTCTGLPDSEFITTEFEYDANRNRTFERFGEASEGRQPTNTETRLYDERDLLFQAVRAAGDPVQSTKQWDYDGNTNVRAGREGLEDGAHVTLNVYDGYDRLTATTDPMGNQRFFGYDANGNRTARRVDGEPIDLPGDAGNVRLDEITWAYDSMDRVTRVTTEHFGPSQAPIGDGQSVTDIVLSDNSQVLQVVDDNSNAVINVYDSINRVSTTTDARGNFSTFEYDRNDNITRRIDTDKSDLGNPDESYTTTFVYDSINRITLVGDNFGNTTTRRYDSRSNRVSSSDAIGTETRQNYDGLNRPTRMTLDLDGDGADGDGLDIKIFHTWDDTSRKIEEDDGLGNTTTYEYDSLNRMTRQIYSDTTEDTSTYDAHDNRVTRTDANGSDVTSDYDALDRLTSITVAPGSTASGDPTDIFGTTFESFSYDGIGRLKIGQDDDSTVTRTYDSLSNILTESQNGTTTTRSYDGVGNKLTLDYPGGRFATYAYDSINRITSVSDGGSLATYDWVGPNRVERRDYANGTRLDLTYDGIANAPGDSGVRQIAGTLHSRISDGFVLDERSYIWDPKQNLIDRDDDTPGSIELEHTYVYDSINRMTRTIATQGAAVPVRNTTYELDDAGNRSSVTDGDGAGLYFLDPGLPNPGDRQMNQYTAIPSGGRAYDANGNLTRSDIGSPAESDYRYDYLDRMVERSSTFSGVRHEYAYDALGRRIEKVVDAHTPTPTRTFYFYDEHRVIEEQAAGGLTQATYVWGARFDEPINMQRAAIDYYYHEDGQGNVMALSDAVPFVVERYEYSDYGRPLDPFSLAPLSGAPSSVGNPYFFDALRLDDETSLYKAATRYYEATPGRFTTRSRGGFSLDLLGNDFQYAFNAPYSAFDPQPDLMVAGSAQSLNPSFGMRRAANGTAHCDRGTGKMVVKINNTNCDKDCTKEHEDKHVDFGKGCCTKVKGELDKCKKDAKCKTETNGKYDKWFDATEDIDECGGYKVGKACREKLRKDKDCDKCPDPPKTKVDKELKKCCDDIDAGIERDKGKIKEHCPGKAVACPF